MRLAIDFGGTNIKLGLIDTNANFMDEANLVLAELPSPVGFIDALFDHLDQFLAGRHPKAIGLATKGGVDLELAEVTSDIGAGHYLVRDDLRKKFEAHFKAPFILDNDARAYALGEYQFGAGKGAKNLVCMTLGTGVGCSLLQEGVAYQSSDPLGGLLGGHLSIDRHGKACTCGSRGCLERYISATALHEIISLDYPEFYSMGQDPINTFFSKASADGDGPLGEELSNFQDNFALGLVNIIHAYGPDRIVIGGGVAQSSKYFLAGVQDRVAEMAWTTPRGKTKIVNSALGYKAALLGMAFHPLLKTRLS